MKSFPWSANTERFGSSEYVFLKTADLEKDDVFMGLEILWICKKKPQKYKTQK